MVRKCPMISSAVYRFRAMPPPFVGWNPNSRLDLVYRRQIKRKARTGQRLITIEKRAETLVTIVTPVTKPPDGAQQEGNGPAQTQEGEEGDTGDNKKQVWSGQGFPRAIEGLGIMRHDGLGRCAHCAELTSFSYGGIHLCGIHARLKAQGRPEGGQ